MVSLIACATALFFNDRLTRAMSNWLFFLYLLFALVMVGRWGGGFVQGARTARQGESFPSPQISLLLGMASIATFFIGSVVTARLVLVRRSKVRVI
ncbi:MAG TPA: hypothetical protein DCR45_04385 [Gammaproteobacteria bacterium]|nr:hypothetical protein [Gammaproteobacteria bacterium]